MKRSVLSGFALSCCLILAGCITPSAVDDFAKASTQAATLFPAVAAIPLDACVTNEQNLQLASVKGFDGNFDFDQKKIDSACKSAEDTSERLRKTYSVLSAYISALDKLAGGNVPTYDTNIKSIASTVPDLTSKQQTAVTGLADLVADLVTKGYRQKEAAKAIEKAQPWVHDLSGMLKEQLPPFLNQYIANETDSLGSLYRDILTFHIDDGIAHSSPALVTKDFIEGKVRIQNAQNAVTAFEKIFASIDEGHTALYNNRNKLWDKGVIQQIFQTASSIEQQVSAVETAFKKTAATAAKK
jgi:hypothetical protein